MNKDISPDTLKTLLNGEKLLIIITGISGSGKTTLANKINERFNISVFSVDDYKVRMYEQYGFYNEEERLIVREMAVNCFKTELMVYMRNGASVLVEYPFKALWQDYFNTVSTIYGYTTLVITCNTRAFDDIWTLRIQRDLSLTNRHKCLVAKSYVKNKLFVRDDKCYEQHMKEQKTAYYSGEYDSIYGDHVITNNDFMKALILM